ncbi:envelope stress sensor histidine kinase CpxA [Vibrio sp. SM6]|uniref:histidine kinase n=1 Tax=Vibrio agarilyticus TaxID=2726741 RepID=A0A7X8TSC4_9VIBR|nr:envelope stress sensor histidine kinase CpxA [Vibrio agarilyticus]NLS14000.1 envelope stress sensor histidine kinase CpxA [Vibrio agarilyticus]
MRLPKFNSLYGRIFAIFWFTMLLVLMAVLSLPDLDPRKTRTIEPEHYQHLLMIRDKLQRRYAHFDDISRIVERFEQRDDDDHDKENKLRFFLAADDGTVLTNKKRGDFRTKAIRNFITSLDDSHQPMQKLYGRYMLSGPLPITLDGQSLQLFIAQKWDNGMPLLLRLFDHPLQLLLAVMAASTPLLLWLAWALSQPARRLENAAMRVAKGEFVTDPSLETGTSEFRQAGTAFNQMVKAVNQMISGQQRLLSDISHELRSPLTRLRMAQSLAVRKQGDSAELERIDTEAQRLERMIGELLELSRMQLNSHMTRENQPLSSLWEEMLEDAQFEAQQMDKRLTLSAIPERIICGNPKLLMSALENVVRNAIYYSRDEIMVTLQDNADSIAIQVDDNGAGVPDDELEMIFRPFYRVSTARDRHSGGTGLGLAITESAVRQHSGTIRASRSHLGGLSIRITLPLVLVS